MEMKDFPPVVQEWLGIVRQASGRETVRMKEYNEKLRTYAEDNGSTILIGLSIYYEGFDCYMNAQLDLSMVLMSEALKYLSMAESWRMASHCYSCMGNIAAFQGDTSLAIDCYIKSLEMARTHDIQTVEYNVRSNIANIHMTLSDYKNALKMLASSEKLIEDGLQVPSDQRAVVLANLCICNTQTGELDLAGSYLNAVKEIIGAEPSDMDRVMICILETQYYNRTGDIAARDAAIRGLCDLSLVNLNVYDSLNELTAHANLLLDIGKLEEFNSLAARMEELSDNPTVRRSCLELRMKQCRLSGDDAGYAKLAVEYYDVAQQRETERNRIVSHNIVTRIRLEEEESRRKEAEQSNVVLRERSEHDPLTGLNNRYKLNELSEAAFQRAYLSKKPLTVEILDIDCYKKFNDNYGHQAGDDCLIQIAGAIRSMEEFPRIHTARYGGDEFVIVYEEYSKEEVEGLAATLRQKILDLNIEHKFNTAADHVTISQGLFHAIPVAGNKLWDFMYSADMALYIVKSRSRDSFHVATNFEQVRDDFNALRNN